MLDSEMTVAEVDMEIKEGDVKDVDVEEGNEVVVPEDEI